MKEITPLCNLIKFNRVFLTQEKRNDLFDWFKGFPKGIFEAYHLMLLKMDPKRRTLVLQGESNAGKSILARFLSLTSWSTGMISRDSSTDVHAYAYAFHMRSVVLLEEPLFTIDNIETMKLVMGGEPMLLNPKNIEPYIGTSQALTIITCNSIPWNNYPNKPFDNRCVKFLLTEPCNLQTYITHDEFWTFTEQWLINQSLVWLPREED